MEWKRDECVLTTDKSRMDVAAVCALLNDTYWAAGRPRELLERAFANSICVSLFKNGAQIGFARAVTDYATFTWICDVVIDPGHRGQGHGKWMVESLLSIPELQTCSQMLATKDAHTLYERHGFQRFEALRRKLEKRN